MKPFLTNHANKRLLEWTGLSVEKFTKIYEERKYLTTGKEQKSRRMHDLFFSEPDDKCFVSIRDEKNFDIVTILPIDYHSNIAWEISPDAQTYARSIFYGLKIDVDEISKVEEKVNLSKFRVVAIGSLNYKRKHIASFFAEEYFCDIGIFAADSSLKNRIQKFFERENRNIYSWIEIIYGNKRDQTKLLTTQSFFVD